MSGLPSHKTSSKSNKVIKPLTTLNNDVIEYYNDPI